MKNLVLSVALAALAGLASAAVVSPLVPRTLTLTKGWNAVFLDVTPEESDPAAFFAFADVTRVGSYQAGVYDSTAQFDSEGEPLNQKPVAYLVWEKGSAASTLKTLSGGHVYLVYANAPAATDYKGVPTLPKMSWLTGESSEGVISMVAPSLPAGVTVPATTYFAEGPWDRKTVYRVLGQNETAPTFLSDIGAKPKVTAGLGYALVGTENCRWAGVIDVRSGFFGMDGLVFPKGVTRSSVTIRNAGTTEHVFRMALAAAAAPEGLVVPKLSLQDPVTNVAVAAAWSPFTSATPRELTLAPGEARTLVFALDRSVLGGVAGCGAVLSVEDLSGTQMRVEMPVLVDPEEEPEAEKFPAGTWAGSLVLSHVTRRAGELGRAYPMDAAMTVMIVLRVDEGGQAKLVQHADMPSGARLITTFLSATTPEVAGSGSAFGNHQVFDWTLDKDARDNPFRHVHHPDHATGKTIVNKLTLTWSNDDESLKFTRNADETTGGLVTWTVTGLTGEEVTSVGMFTLKRLKLK